MVSVHDLFAASALDDQPLQVVHSIVHVGRYRFLVYGFSQLQLQPNALLREIKPGSVWRGEIVLFLLKKRRRLDALMSPGSLRRTLRERAIQLYA